MTGAEGTAAARKEADRSTFVLERREPPYLRGERIRLEAGRGPLGIGRAEENPIRLYSDSASRQHAWLVPTEAGDWRLELAKGRSVRLDGDEETASVLIEHGMNLEFGEDALRCLCVPAEAGFEDVPAAGGRTTSMPAAPHAAEGSTPLARPLVRGVLTALAAGGAGGLFLRWLGLG